MSRFKVVWKIKDNKIIAEFSDYEFAIIHVSRLLVDEFNRLKNIHQDKIDSKYAIDLAATHDLLMRIKPSQVDDHVNNVIRQEIRPYDEEHLEYINVIASRGDFYLEDQKWDTYSETGRPTKENKFPFSATLVSWFHFSLSLSDYDYDYGIDSNYESFSALMQKVYNLINQLEKYGVVKDHSGVRELSRIESEIRLKLDECNQSDSESKHSYAILNILLAELTQALRDCLGISEKYLKINFYVNESKYTHTGTFHEFFQTIVTAYNFQTLTCLNK